MVKILALVFSACLQVVLSQQEQQQQQQQQQPYDFVGNGMTAAQMWNPSTWSTPYYVAASQAWTDYLKKVQEASNQLYKQWDMTDAGNLFNAGMGLAQQAGSQAQQGVQTAADKIQEGAQVAKDKANEGAQEAVNQGQQGAQAAAEKAQQLLSNA